MQFKVHHRTEYHYSRPITNNSNELRLTPPNTESQQCLSSYISVVPATRLKSYSDLNGNRVHHFEIPRPHQRLSIDCFSTIETQPAVDFSDLPYGSSHDTLSACCSLEKCHTFLQSSPLVEVTPESWRRAIDIQDHSTDIFQTSYAIMEYIFEHYTYDPDSTTVTTHANEVLKQQTGVCQDFAHAMTALCRSIHIPTRYVSGYFFDATRDHILRGASASHAWVEVYIPHFGWIGLDPTNNKVVDETYIKVATGQDYRAVAPIMGSYYGGERSGLVVSVRVDRIE
ncbi:transglutaminase domain-containing protein [Rubritalea spongiae]|uniref:Transglutaminase domain-containing protein n=1 Tax=Rubritalea spongiae TaxID=430797 RepID=A0ABW5DXJ6_9BACT